jgi:hypothetical protein
VGHIGVDDNQIVHIHREHLILDQELAPAADNEEKLRMAVGVGDGMPVAAVAGGGRIQQFCGTPNGKGLIPAQAVVMSAHKKPAFALGILILYCIFLLQSIAEGRIMKRKNISAIIYFEQSY